ncbi:unnamed protein product [Psylliodes chrysocephalus]|uniref:Uncharacterized protein n=1 Tax=Psylliodes chrysocephalus TaxID=3402493 RepID=A0A9P0CMU0_9CUCU|nr:unnamed protein product [Psylliodes chrysocephala]
MTPTTNVTIVSICISVMFFTYRYISEISKTRKSILIPLLLCCATFCIVQGYPGEDFRYIDRDLASPGAHQLASWLASQLRPKEIIPVEVPIIPYRLPLQGKRNSEVTNAMIGSEETQKMYREGR